jgi:hypothetical protein
MRSSSVRRHHGDLRSRHRGRSRVAEHSRDRSWPQAQRLFLAPSVEHYLILDPERRVVIHHKRGGSDAIETRVLSEGAVKLNPPGFWVAVEAVFSPP